MSRPFAFAKPHQPTLKPKLGCSVCPSQRIPKPTDKPTDEEEARCPNSVYVAIAGEMVNRRFVLLRNFVLNGKVSASNPLLHIHANR
ncbi:MAG TPA: hypothetical protein ENN08_05020 [Bacteroidales bacterium]|nr:hypothetical protein [Bacteroidales bacterium]